MTENISQAIREYRRVFEASPAGSYWLGDSLCCAYNWATSPTRAMTDREHKACRRFAAYVRRRLAGWAVVTETDSGRLVLVRPK